MKFWIATWMLLLTCAVTAVAEPQSIAVKVQRLEDKSYHVKMEFLVNAPVEQLHGLLTDYDNISQLNPAIVSSQLLHTSEQNKYRVETVTEDCFLLFCKTIKRVEDVHSPSERRINSVIIPDQSDFSSGIAAWTLTSEADQTHVLYEAVLAPKFKMPPVIGTMAVESRLEKWLQQSAMRIEELAISNSYITLNE